MVVVLIRMRLRVLANSLRGARAASVVVGALGGLAFAVLCVAAVASGAGDSEVGADLSAAIGLLWLLGWLVGPILTGGGDETLRPENFALLPLSPRRLATGLVVASLAGVAPLVTVVAFLGTVVWGASLGAVPALVAVLGIAGQFAVVVLASRVVVAAIGAALNTRRGRDLGVLLGAAVGLLYLPARGLFEQLAPVLTSRESTGLSVTLRALPSGWAAAATASAASGSWLLAIAPLLGLAAVAAALWLAWTVLLRRRLTSSGPPRQARAATARAGTWRASGPLAAVVRKELLLWWRDSQRRALLGTSMLLGVLIPVFAGSGSRGLVAFAALWLVFFSVMQVSNLYGFDGDAVWHTLVSPGAARVDVPGRQLAWLAIVVPPTVLVAVLAPLLTGRGYALGWLAGLVPATLGGGAGLLVLLSVVAPYAVPRDRRNPFSGGSNPGCTRVLLRLASLLGLVVVALPTVVLDAVGSVLDVPALLWVGAVVGVATGVGAAFGLGAVARNRLERRGPEVLAAVRAS